MVATADAVLTSVVGGLVAVVVLLVLLRAVQGEGPLRALCGCDGRPEGLLEGYDNAKLSPHMQQLIRTKCYQGAGGTQHLAKIFNLASAHRTAVYNACKLGRDDYAKAQDLSDEKNCPGNRTCKDPYLKKVYPCTNRDGSKCCNKRIDSCVPKDFAKDRMARMNLNEGLQKCREACRDDGQYCKYVMDGDKERCCSRLNDNWCVTVGKAAAPAKPVMAAQIGGYVDVKTLGSGYNANKVTYWNADGKPTQFFNGLVGSVWNLSDYAANGWDAGVRRILIPAGTKVTLYGGKDANDTFGKLELGSATAPQDVYLMGYKWKKSGSTFDSKYKCANNDCWAVRVQSIRVGKFDAWKQPGNVTYAPANQLRGYDANKATFWNMDGAATQHFNDGKTHELSKYAAGQWHRGFRRIHVPNGKQVVLTAGPMLTNTLTLGAGNHFLLEYKFPEQSPKGGSYKCNNDCWGSKVRAVQVRTPSSRRTFPGVASGDAGKIIFFEHPGGQGKAWKLTPGQAGALVSGANNRVVNALPQDAIDEVSSVYVPPGYHIWLHEHDNGGGANIKLDGNTDGALFNLGNFEWLRDTTGKDQGSWQCNNKDCWDDLASSFSLFANNNPQPAQTKAK